MAALGHQRPFNLIVAQCPLLSVSGRSRYKITVPKKQKGTRTMYQLIVHKPEQAPWNKGKLVGQKLPLKLQEIWAIRIRLQLEDRHRDLALFNLAVDSKLRACDLLRLRVSDVSNGGRVGSRAMIMQKKTRRPVQFEITARTREAVTEWIRRASLKHAAFLFPGRSHRSMHLSTRQYARMVESWVAEVGLDSTAYGTHSLRRTKVSLIYRLPTY